MPVIFVSGLPEEMKEEEIIQLYEDIASREIQIEELHNTKDQITVFFPPDRMKFDLGKEIIVFIFGLFIKPERTDDVRGRLAQNIGEGIKKRFPEAFVECFVVPFDPRQGYWSSRPI